MAMKLVAVLKPRAARLAFGSKPFFGRDQAHVLGGRPSAADAQPKSIRCFRSGHPIFLTVCPKPENS